MAPVIVSLRQVVLDCTDARGLSEFYRQLLRFRHREGDVSDPRLHDELLKLLHDEAITALSAGGALTPTWSQVPSSPSTWRRRHHRARLMPLFWQSPSWLNRCSRGQT